MEKEPSFLVSDCRVYDVFGKLERWSIIDLYREANVLPSVAECVLENVPMYWRREVGRTMVNRWGVSYPIYEFVDAEKREDAFRRSRHSHCWTDKEGAQFPDNFLQCPSGFEVPHLFFSEGMRYFNREVHIGQEEEWLQKCCQSFLDTAKRGMYEDTDEAEQVFAAYKTIYGILLELWGLEIDSVKTEGIHLPQTFRNSLAQATGHLLLSGRHHMKPVETALTRWYASPLVQG